MASVPPKAKQQMDKMDMRSAYQEGLQKRLPSSSGVHTTGRNKGFSNEGVSNLMNLGDSGPLDTANNANSRANKLNLKM